MFYRLLHSINTVSTFQISSVYRHSHYAKGIQLFWVTGHTFLSKICRVKARTNRSAQSHTCDNRLLYEAHCVHCLVSSPLYSSLWWDSMFQYDDISALYLKQQNNRNSAVHARAAFSMSLVGHFSTCYLRTRIYNSKYGVSAWLRIN